jgi:hypothetical protein
MDNRIPIVICELLNLYLTHLNHEVPGLVTGLYLHGSIALDAFDETQSDIDFLAFLSRRATAADVKSLRSIHQAIASPYPRWLLEGSYLQWGDLGELSENVAPSITHHENKLVEDDVFDINLVTWWVLKHHGIALIGLQPQDLPFEVDWNLLIARMKENLNTYWAAYAVRPRRIAWLLSDYGIEWIVLGVLRQYYTFVADDITSKSGAGTYALEHLPSKWHRLIREALHIRQGESVSLYSSKILRAADGYHFLRYMIHYCNTLPL